MHTFKSLILISSLFFAPLLAAQPAPALEKTDRVAIQGVIEAQIKAFATEDNVAAFLLATPDVRRQFGNADAFMTMVKQTYESLYRNRSTTFLEAAIINGNVIQPMRIVERDGDVVIALYTLERQANGEWRVSGCQLAPSDLQAT